MKTVIGLMLALGLILTAAPSTRAADGKINVVAAENFYGDVARQIGGDDVAVASIMSNPDQDPHLFETTPSTVRQIRRRRTLSSTAQTTTHGWISCSRPHPSPSVLQSS